MSKHPSFRISSLFLNLFILALALPQAAAEGESSVNGTLTANGKKMELPYVFVYAEEKGFYDEKDPTWRVIFAEKPIEIRELDGFLSGGGNISGMPYPELARISHRLS